MSAPPTGRRRAERIGSSFRAAHRTVVFLLLTFTLLPLQVAAVTLRLPLARRLPRLYHRLCCRHLGLDILVRGSPSGAKPTLFVSNHISYIDIVVLGALIEASFIAKDDVAGWPLIGPLARLAGTVFVARRAPHVARQRDEIAGRLRAGDNLVLFPEGTSGDGLHVLPFKSALFSVAEQGPGGVELTVQPVSIAYTRLDGVPLGRSLRPHLAWYGDMTLVPHLFTWLGLGTITVEVTFHEPIAGPARDSRKALAESTREIIAKGVNDANSGRASSPAPAGGASTEKAAIS